MLQFHSPFQSNVSATTFSAARHSVLSDPAAAFSFRKLSLDVHSRSPLDRKSNNTEHFSSIAWLLLLQGREMSTLKKNFTIVMISYRHQSCYRIITILYIL